MKRTMLLLGLLAIGGYALEGTAAPAIDAAVTTKAPLPVNDAKVEATTEVAEGKALNDDTYRAPPKYTPPQQYNQRYNQPEEHYDRGCESNPHLCPANSICKDTKGGYTCDCGPRQEFLGGQCRLRGELVPNKDECFLEYPLQFLEYGKDQEDAVHSLYQDIHFNPGKVPKSNVGIAMCKEACRNDIRCEAAVVKHDPHDNEHYECFHRLLRTDEKRPSVNNILHNLKKDDNAVSFVKAPCGACCQYPGVEPAHTSPVLSFTASSSEECCAMAGLSPDGRGDQRVAVFKTDEHEHENCFVYRNVPHPADNKHGYKDDDSSITLVGGSCKKAFEFYEHDGEDCCVSYKNKYFPVTTSAKSGFGPVAREVADEEGSKKKKSNWGVHKTAPGKQFSVLTARRQCCAYCKEHHDCTGAQLVNGYCTLFTNKDLKKDNIDYLNAVDSLVTPFEIDVVDEVEVIFRTWTSCDHLYCAYPQLELNDEVENDKDDITLGTVDDLTLEKREKSKTWLDQCWGHCQGHDDDDKTSKKKKNWGKKDCHSVNIFTGLANPATSPKIVYCDLVEGSGPIGVRSNELKTTSNTIVSIFKPNPDQTCSPPIEPEPQKLEVATKCEACRDKRCNGAKVDNDNVMELNDCPAGTVLSITSAFYGRENNKICTGDGKADAEILKDTDCGTTAALRTSALADVQRLCQNKNDCHVPVTNKFFEDPCEGTLKYLTVHYFCK